MATLTVVLLGTQHVCRFELLLDACDALRRVQLRHADGARRSQSARRDHVPHPRLQDAALDGDLSYGLQPKQLVHASILERTHGVVSGVA